MAPISIWWHAYQIEEETAMVEDMTERPEDEKSFEELLEAYEKGESQEIRVGERIQAKVLSIGRESVFVDTGSKMDGVVDKAELLDESGGLSCKVGDILDLYVVSFTESEVRLSRALSGAGNLGLLKEAFDEGIPVKGKVRGTCKGGYEITVMQRRAFCPASQMDLKYVENPQEYVGKSFRFLVTQLVEGGRNIVVSRRRLMERELEKAKAEFLSGLEEGQILEGKVTRLVPYGAFVEIFPGIEGMVHLSELSWSRVDAPEEVVQASQQVKVKVIGLEQNGAARRPKISLSIKETGLDPWYSVDSDFQEGQIVEGKVKRCAPFGAFVEIASGIEGLVHISEMSYRRRIIKPEEMVRPGDLIKVMIKEIDSSGRRISLSMKDVEGDPWADIMDRYQQGQTIEGRLEKKESYGYFISLEPGITGLMPRSSMEKSPYGSDLERRKEGDIIPVVIEQINQPEKRITLLPASGAEEVNWQRFRGQSTALGSLGEKLQEAMKAKRSRG